MFLRGRSDAHPGLQALADGLGVHLDPRPAGASIAILVAGCLAVAHVSHLGEKRGKAPPPRAGLRAPSPPIPGVQPAQIDGRSPLDREAHPACPLAIGPAAAAVARRSALAGEASTADRPGRGQPAPIGDGWAPTIASRLEPPSPSRFLRQPSEDVATCSLRRLRGLRKGVRWPLCVARHEGLYGAGALARRCSRGGFRAVTGTSTVWVPS